MFNSEHQSNFKIRSCPRFEKNNLPISRYPVYSFRRPFPLVRRRMMTGRYPNVGFRPTGLPVFRPCFSPRGTTPERYPSPYSSPRAASPIAERPPFSCTPPNIPQDNQNQAMNPDITNNPCNQRPFESTECISQLNERNCLSNVWIETLAPSGKTYYYNANTRATTWVRPVHAQIIDLNEIKRLKIYGEECLQSSPRRNLNFVQSFPSSPYDNNCLIRNIPVAQRFMTFPPPQNVCNPPPILPVPAPGSVQMNSSIAFNPVVPPLNFTFPTGGQMLNNATIHNEVVPAGENKHYPLIPFARDISNELREKEYKILDWSVSNSETSLGIPNDLSRENVYIKEQSETQYISRDSHLNILRKEDAGTEANVSSLEKQENSVQDFSPPDQFLKEKDEEQIKTSTPISGTKWRIVTKKDGKTYYFDSERKIAVWERPTELMNPRLLIEQHMGESIPEKEQNIPREPDDCNPKCENNDAELKESLTNESECLTGEEEEENRTEQVDKTRPVSSTPVSGTTWFVVWTGDEKVFYFDSLRKVSVWERPAELLNRLDVHKLVEKSPLAAGIKSSKKESRKIESDDSDTTKKIKKENDADLKEDNENEDKNTDMKIQEEIPHDERVKIFCEMLAEKKVSAFSTWEKELHKIVFDSRYLLLPSKERKQVFESFISKKIEEEKKERQRQLQMQKENFLSLLKEVGVNVKSRFSDISKICAKDERFKSIEKLRQRENVFNEYISELIKKERDREKAKAERRKKFLQLLGEQKFTDIEITWAKMKEKISEDERYKAIQSSSVKEELFKEYLKDLHSNSSTVDRDRVSTSIRNREKEVKRDLSVHLRDREREQEHHKSMSAVSDFHALLNDLIKKPDISWHSAKKLMKKDHRWSLVQCLESENLEELFNQHVDSLNLKKTEQFHSLLDEVPDLTFKSSWLDVRKVVLNDPRCAKFSSSERKCEREFKDYLRRKLSAAKADFQELLRETKIITHRSKSLLGDTNHLRDVEEVLSQDRRYLNLDCVRSDRKEILLSYIDKLHENGPPPPPTATLPTDRLK